MINFFEVNETNKMVEQENLDVRTITIGISLLECIDSNLDKLNENIYNRITTVAKDLAAVGEKIEHEFGIPIVNKRISITPVALVGGSACKKPEDFVTIAETLDKAAKEVGVNFIGGYSAIVSKGMTKSDELLIRSIPMAMAKTERVCSSVNVGSTKTGIDMDAVRLCGEIVKETAEATKDKDSIGCAKFVVLCNAPDDNPFMAGAFLGVTEGDAVINVGVSGPGVVKRAIEKCRGEGFQELCDTIKKTAFKVTRVGQLVADGQMQRQRVCGADDQHALYIGALFCLVAALIGHIQANQQAGIYLFDVLVDALNAVARVHQIQRCADHIDSVEGIDHLGGHHTDNGDDVALLHAESTEGGRGFLDIHKEVCKGEFAAIILQSGLAQMVLVLMAEILKGAALGQGHVDVFLVIVLQPGLRSGRIERFTLFSSHRIKSSFLSSFRCQKPTALQRR